MLFLGAGSSVSSGGRTAEEISLGILRKLYPGARDDDAAADAFRNEHGRTPTFESVLDVVGATQKQQRSLLESSFANMEPSKGYEHLALLILYGYFNPIILSTNFDTMLEDSLAAACQAWGREREVKVLVQEDLVSDSFPKDNVIRIVKLHGNWKRLDHPLRLTTRDTARLDPMARSLVNRLFSQFGIVVVGYRLKDVGIRNALQDVHQSDGSFSCIVPDPSMADDPETNLLIERHSAPGSGVVTSSFDQFFEALGGGLQEVACRNVAGSRLDAGWERYLRACLFGRERGRLLDELQTEALALAESFPSIEAQALLECVSYQRHPQGGWYHLEYGEGLLEQVAAIFHTYRRVVGDIETAWPEFVLLIVQRDLFLVGKPGDEGRPGRIVYVEDQAEALRRRISVDDMWHVRCLIICGEAAKERALASASVDERKERVRECRRLCESALRLLGESRDAESKLWRAIAKRHLGVSFELEADTSADHATRQRLYGHWSELSSQAVDILDELGEDTVRSYALMNRASSFQRLATFTPFPERKRELLNKGRDDLMEAIAGLNRVDDERGLVWSYVHLCENLRSQMNLSPDSGDGDGSYLANDLEEAAAAAVSHARLIGDELAQALATRELGYALTLPRISATKLQGWRADQAIALLWEAATALEAVGFYRGAGHAYSSLADVFDRAWSESNELPNLVQGIKATAAAIVTMGEAFGEPERLATLFDHLQQELRYFLDL